MKIAFAIAIIALLAWNGYELHRLNRPQIDPAKLGLAQAGLKGRLQAIESLHASAVETLRKIRQIELAGAYGKSPIETTLSEQLYQLKLLEAQIDHECQIAGAMREYQIAKEKVDD